MAARLTDKQKKKIIADYIQLGSYNAVAKLNGVSPNTVKALVKGNADIAQKCKQKKEENTTAVLAYMEQQRCNVCELLDLYLKELKNPEKIDAAGLREIATTMAILIDKYSDKKDSRDTNTDKELPQLYNALMEEDKND